MNDRLQFPAWTAAALVPLLYLLFYTPYGMDTTDFGYFYGYSWRILQGEFPYRDFSYIKPALPLYWHAFWLWITPEQWQVLAGKAGFLASMLASAWLGTLYLADNFDFEKLRLPVPLLATGAFVFGIHCFPHMPWHTADGVLFCAGALWISRKFPLASGILAACAMCCKQSFLLVPVAILLLIWLRSPRSRDKFLFLAGWLGFLVAACLWIYSHDAWKDFRAMTTGQLDIREALDAGIMIYLRQNWIIPAAAFLPWLIIRLLKKPLPQILNPCLCYLLFLAIWSIWLVFRDKTWIGFGVSWPTFFMLMGALCVLFPGQFLAGIAKGDSNLAASVTLAASLVASWSTAISGGYKIPAFFAAPLFFSFFLVNFRIHGHTRTLAWLTLLCGIVIFGVAWRYPYVFPSRPLEKSRLSYDAGQVYKKASGVMVDEDMLARLRELKKLREKYGPNYKTLPGFSLSYFLNNDKPVYGSDWLIDWEINGDVDRLYQELLDKKLTVFMERDQLDAVRADNYDRAGYGVPQRVRHNWRIVEETPHFVVFQPPHFGNGQK